MHASNGAGGGPGGLRIGQSGFESRQRFESRKDEERKAPTQRAARGKEGGVKKQTRRVSDGPRWRGGPCTTDDLRMQ